MKGIVSLASFAAVGVAASYSPLPPGVIKIPMTRILNQSAYGIEFEVGTPPQKNILKVDSGSPTIGFENPRNNICQQPGGLCDLYGIYNNLSSSTAVYSSNSYRDFLVDLGVGSFINDTLSFGGTTVPAFQFGTYDQIGANFPITTPISGILGMGEFCFTNVNCSDYPGFVQQLFEKGIISKRAFSVYLGPDNPNATGTLILGGIDRAKRTGPVGVLPYVNPTSSEASNGPFNMNYTSMSLVSATGNSTTFSIMKGSFAIWDTGNPAWGLPQAAFESVTQYFELPTNTSTGGDPLTVDCKFRQPTTTTLNVGLLNGFVVNIPLHRLVTQLDTNTCIISVTGFSGTGSAGGVGAGWGDAFLRNVYATFDLDSGTITVSNVKYTDEEDIVAI
jgi:hypothetical protein